MPNNMMTNIAKNQKCRPMDILQAEQYEYNIFWDEIYQ